MCRLYTNLEEKELKSKEIIRKVKVKNYNYFFRITAF